MTSNEFNELLKYFLNCGTDNAELFAKAQTAVINSRNPYFCFRFSMLPGADVIALGEVIIASGDAELNKKQAVHRNTNVVAHENVVIESGKNVLKRDNHEMDYCVLDTIHKFARFVPGADVKALGQVVIDSGDIHLNRKFSKIKGADKLKHKMVFKYSSDSEKREAKTKVESIINNI